jgi:hypothetical protein
MTNLLFLTPDIPVRCTNYKTYTANTTDTPNEIDFRPFKNTLRGEKWQLYESSDSFSSNTEVNAVYDLGVVSGVDNTASSNFIVLSRLDYMANLAPTTIIDFALQSSSDDSTYTDRYTITDLTNADLVGPWTNDHVSLFSATSAFRYWRTHWDESTSGGFTVKIGKVYFGTAFDIGTDPSDFSVERLKEGSATFVSDSGVEYQSRVKHPTYEIKLTYEGLTDAEVQSFKDEIVKYRSTTPVFLYTSSFHEPTDGKQLIFCKLAEWNTTQRKRDWNNLTCRWIESVG